MGYSKREIDISLDMEWYKHFHNRDSILNLLQIIYQVTLSTLLYSTIISKLNGRLNCPAMRYFF